MQLVCTAQGLNIKLINFESTKMEGRNSIYDATAISLKMMY